jgi:hypothetical protein
MEIIAIITFMCGVAIGFMLGLWDTKSSENHLVNELHQITQCSKDCCRKTLQENNWSIRLAKQDILEKIGEWK